MFFRGMRPPVSGSIMRGVLPIPPEGSTLGVVVGGVGGWYEPPEEEPLLPEVLPVPLFPPRLLGQFHPGGK